MNVPRAIRHLRAATCAAALCVAAAACDPTCADECQWDTWRCSSNKVEYCTSAYRDECGGAPSVWETLDGCGSGEVCTTQGCAKGGACCVASP